MHLRPPRLTRPLTRASTSFSLHLAGGEASDISTRLRVIALCVSLLASKAVFGIFLLALGVESLAVGTATTTLGFRVLSGGGDVKEVFFVG